jgi:hypothetical protein
MKTKTMWIEISNPYMAPHYMVTLHRKDVTRGDARDSLSPGMIAVYEVDAVNKEDAIAKIMLGKAKKVMG